MRLLGIVSVFLLVGCSTTHSENEAAPATIQAPVKASTTVLDSIPPPSGPPTMSLIADVFARTEGGTCELKSPAGRSIADQIAKTQQGIDNLAGIADQTKGDVEASRSLGVRLAALEALPADAAVSEYKCFRPGSSAWTFDDRGENRVFLLQVCCKPDSSLVDDLTATGVTLDVSQIPDDGTANEPAP